MIFDYWTIVGLAGLGLSLFGWLTLWLTRPARHPHQQHGAV